MTDFRDFNFKLLVVEELMYVQETLTPAFSIDEHLRENGVAESAYDHTVAIGREYTMLDEARAYFEALEIEERLLATVEELNLDGGNQVYMECAPVWDGEDDLFDVHSLEDLRLLPNLKRVLGAEMVWRTDQDKLDALTARGIAAL